MAALPFDSRTMGIPGSMPRYHLNLYNGTGLTQDEEGQQFPDVEAAERAAIAGARSILADEVRNGELDLAGRVEVTDGDGTVIKTVQFRDVLRIKPAGD